MNKPMNSKHVAILRAMCGPRAFLLVERRPNSARRGTLVVQWERSKLIVCGETVEKWQALEYITPSGHLSESYIITDTGRAFVAKFDEPDIPLSMAKVYEAQRAARVALVAMRGRG